MGLPFPSAADLPAAGKITTPDALAARVAQAQAAGGRVVFTNGVFDLLHVGHARYLAQARALGDALVVAVNADESVRLFKGDLRPVVPLAERMELLASLACVDGVVAFATRTPAPLIARVRPAVYVKGGDYVEADLPEAALVRGYGGDVQILPFVAGRSTTGLIARIRAAYGPPEAQPESPAGPERTGPGT